MVEVMFYVYLLVDPSNNKIGYIGKTNNPHKRFMEHRSTARSGTGHLKKDKWFSCVERNGISPVMFISSIWNSDLHARLAEITLIRENVKTVNTISNMRMDVAVIGNGVITAKRYEEFDRIQRCESKYFPRKGESWEMKKPSPAQRELLTRLGPTPRTLEELEPRRERRGVMANTLWGLHRRGYSSVCRRAWAITDAGKAALESDD